MTGKVVPRRYPTAWASVVGKLREVIDRGGRGCRVPHPGRRQRALVAAEESVGGEDLEAGIGGRDEHDHHPAALRRSLLLGVRDCGLVTVVPVGDQELAIGECLGDALTGKPPESGVTGTRSGSRSGDHPGGSPS